MLAISVETNFKQLRGLVQGLGKQGNFAAAVALTKTAMTVRDELKGEMATRFDRPTRWTLNSLYMRRAEKRDRFPQAEVWLKGEYPGDPRESFLRPQIFGGARKQKVFEQMLQRARVLPPGWVTVPGRAAKLDRYGNQSPQEIIQILSALSAFPQGGIGYTMNRTKQSQKKRKAQLRDIFFSSPYLQQKADNGGRLPWGVWERTKRGQVRCLLFFVRRAAYRKRFPFFETADKVVRRDLETQFFSALRQALATARD